MQSSFILYTNASKWYNYHNDVFMSFPYDTLSDQYLIFGAEEGIYTLNLNEIHESTMEQVRAFLLGLSKLGII